MPIYLLSESAGSGRRAAVEAGLKAAIPGLVETSSLDSLLKSGASKMSDDSAIGIIILPQGDPDSFDRFVDFAAQHSREMFLILIGDEITASDYKRLIRSGGADWASANANPAEVLEIIGRRRRHEADERSLPTSAAGGRPVTISFVPSAGGVGNTTLVIETAAQLKTDKSTRQRKICIVDLDFQTSHICDYLDSEPRLQIADLSTAPERLDEHLLESFRTRHSSGIDVFAAPRSKFSWGSLNIEALDALFSMIARQYDLVLIDYPVPWFPWTAQVVAASDACIITGINTIPCLRQVSETLALVRSSGSAGLHVGIAVNRCEYTMLGSITRQKHVEMALRDERLFFIANRPEAIENINMGQPMILGTSARKLRKDLAPLADFCAGVQPSLGHPI
jgi:pilus assembly protein CpaE